MNTRPLHAYLEAREALARGERAEAATLLAKAFGAERSTAPIEENLHQLLAVQGPAQELAMDLMLHEAARRR